MQQAVVRLSRKSDRDTVVQMMVNSYWHHAAKQFLTCELSYAYKFFDTQQRRDDLDILVLTHADEDGKRVPVGMMIVYIQDYIFGPHKIAGDLLLWIEPEYRNYKNWTALRKAFEEWAISKGCNVVGLAHMDEERIDKLYALSGYKPVEVHYMKVL